MHHAHTAFIVVYGLTSFFISAARRARCIGFSLVALGFLFLNASKREADLCGG